MRSLVGLVVGRLGPRADGAVRGTFLTLVVAQHTRSLFMVTFALTAHRLLSWLAYPLIGRWSDRTDTRTGRRVPYMAGGLLVMSACTVLYATTDSYWPLVGVIVVARQARVAYSLPEFTSVPEIFGRSRWIKALISVGIGGFAVGALIRVTVIATWDEADPSTWSPAFYLAAAFMAAAGLAILLLVREAPAARAVARSTPDHPWRERIADLLAVPNAKVLAGAVLLGAAASGATARAFPLYAKDVLGATGAQLALSGLLAPALGIVVSFPLGYWLAVRFERKPLVMAGTLVFAAEALLHIFLVRLWQSVALGVLSGAVGAAMVIAVAPFALQTLPRTGSMGERFGLYVGPVSFVAVVASYASSLTYDHVVHDYRVIWVFPTIFILAAAFVLRRLHIPPGRERSHPIALFEQVAAMFGHDGVPRDRRLFGGEVTEDDVDPMVFFDRARRAGHQLEGTLAYRIAELPSTVDGAVVEGILELLRDDVVYVDADVTIHGKDAVLSRLAEVGGEVRLAFDPEGLVSRIER